MATWTDIDAIAGALPQAQVGTSYGHRAWKVRKKLLVWDRPLRKTERVALGDAAPAGALVGLPTAHIEARDDLILAMPHVFLSTPHLARHPIVLARLDPLPVDVLRHLIQHAWARVVPAALARDVLDPSP